MYPTPMILDTVKSISDSIHGLPGRALAASHRDRLE
jgi:hypothetical protein